MEVTLVNKVGIYCFQKLCAESHKTSKKNKESDGAQKIEIHTVCYFLFGLWTMDFFFLLSKISL